jgi:hypothetical protein
MVSSKNRRKTIKAAQISNRAKEGRVGGRSKAASEGQDNRVVRPSAKATGAKPGSKQALLVELLCRPSGAGNAVLVKTLGWLPHTVRAAMTGLRKKGFTVTRSKNAQGESVYRAIPPVAEAVKSKSPAKAAETRAAG